MNNLKSNNLNTNNQILIQINHNNITQEPIILSSYQNDQHTQDIKYSIIIEPNLEATIIEDYYDNNSSYNTNIIIEIQLSKKSKINYYQIQNKNYTSSNTSNLIINQEQNSEFYHHAINLGSKLSKNSLEVNFQQSAKCLLNGIYLAQNTQYLEQQIIVNHQVPDCTSIQNYKGMIMDHAHAIFNSKIMVTQNAQRTHATQQNKNLLLSKNATINTKPQLEIFANDVICTHGATVGYLDDDAIFYLQSRGLNHHKAKQYLIKAFIDDNLQLLQNLKLKDLIIKLIEQKLNNKLLTQG